MTSGVRLHAWRTTLVLASLAVWALAASAQTRPQRERHVVVVDGHPVSVWSRRSAEPDAVVLLVHGRTWSSLPDFDLDVPGFNRSVLVSLAARGLAAYAVDLRGYGATPVDPSGWLTPSRAVTDISTVVEWIAARHPTLPRPVIVGWSRGGGLAMLAARQIPDRLSGIVVYGFAFDPASPFVDTLAPPGQAAPRVANTAEAARSDFMSPAVTDPAVVRAFVAQALAVDPIRANVRGDGEFNAILPDELHVPVLFIYGDRDPLVVPAAVERLVQQMPAAADPVVLEGADHAAHLESTHEAWVEAVTAFVRGVR